MGVHGRITGAGEQVGAKPAPFINQLVPVSPRYTMTKEEEKKLLAENQRKRELARLEARREAAMQQQTRMQQAKQQAARAELRFSYWGRK
jgi:hypothetical protein